MGSTTKTESHIDIDDIGPVIRFSREVAGLTLIECARRASISKSTLSLVERGERRPSAALVERLARIIAEEIGDSHQQAS